MDFCKLGLAVIETEAQAIFQLQQRINHDFSRACEKLLACNGRIIVTGMGKSGHIARKIAATLASTGSPAFFMHPGEAGHGDSGMITREDCILALSYSGNTPELVQLLPIIKRLNIPLITLVGDSDSLLAKSACINLNVHVEQEACPLGLAPTTSTTVALVMGDALAVALLQARGFTADDFAMTHPSGILGKRLLIYIDDLYHTGEAFPCVPEHATLQESLAEMTAKKLGMVCVTDKFGKLAGVFTDGDVRRTLLTCNYHPENTLIKEVMTKRAYTISKGKLAAEALALMQKHSITSLVVINEQQYPYAVLHVHDLLRAGIY